MNINFSPKLFESSILGYSLLVLLVVSVAYLIIYGLLKVKNKPSREDNEIVGIDDEIQEENVQSLRGVGFSTVLGTRPYQEDACDVFDMKDENGDEVYFAIVCDGMGGMDDGAKASNYACEKFVEIMKSNVDTEDIPSLFKESVLLINKEISQFTNSSGEKINSGTTLVGVLVKNNILSWVSVGDSRIYLYRDDKLTQLTRDHIYMLKLLQLVEIGELTYEEAESDYQKDALISYLGMEKLSLIDTNEEQILLQDSDVIILCSDGIPKLLNDIQIQSVLMSAKDLTSEQTASLLINCASECVINSQDNTTVAAIKI